MANRYEGEKCPICQSYLFEEDDIVVCPVCGAPQHRDCYNTVGHCGLAQLHGTPEQYDLVRSKKAEANAEAESAPQAEQNGQAVTHCPRCQKEVPDGAMFCPYCSMPLQAKVQRMPFGGPAVMYTSFDPCGGIHKKTDIGGITAEQAADFVGPNAPRYLHKFLRLNNRKTGWNWAAFLLPYGWFFSRKQFKWGILTALLMLAATVCLIPMQAVITNTILALPSGSSWVDVANKIATQPTDIGNFEIGMSFLGLGLALLVRIFSGLFGDYAYRNHVVHWVKKIEADEELDNAEAFRKKGGLNPLFFIIAYFVFDWLTSTLLTLLI